MAGEVKIKPGTKFRVAFDVGIGKEPEFSLVCTFKAPVDESAFLVSIPMLEGKALIPDDGQKFLFRYDLGGEPVILAGYVDDIVKEGIRRYWKVRRVSETRQFIQRADIRIKAVLRIEYKQDTWYVEEDGTIEKRDAMTLDISNGGMACYLNARFEVGELVDFSFPRLGTADEASIDEVVGVVCWSREAPKGSLYRNVIGVQYRFADPDEKKKMQDYVYYARKKFKL